jgi:hypothetical protein
MIQRAPDEHACAKGRQLDFDVASSCEDLALPMTTPQERACAQLSASSDLNARHMRTTLREGPRRISPRGKATHALSASDG